EGVPGGDVVVEDGLVGVHGALGLPGGPGGEVDQGDVVGGGLPGGVVVPAGLEEGAEVEAVGGCPAPTGVDDDDVLEMGETIPDRLDLAAVEEVGRDEDPSLPDGHPGLDRLRPERREEGGDGGAVFESTQERDVELGDAVGEDEHGGAQPHTESVESRSETEGLPGELAVCDVERVPRAWEPPERNPIGFHAAEGVPGSVCD